MNQSEGDHVEFDTLMSDTDVAGACNGAEATRYGCKRGATPASG